MIPSRDPARPETAEVRIPPREALAAVALAAAGREFMAEIIYSTASAATTVWTLLLLPRITDPQGFDPPPPPPPPGTVNLAWSGV